METRAKPMTHPARYAARKASSREFFARNVTLKLVLVAIIIPKVPHKIETKAPTKKQIAVATPCSVRNVSIMNISPTNIKQIRYYCLRNSLAPSAIFPPRLMSIFLCCGVI